MKITIIGAAGLRTPLIVKAMAARQGRINLTELALMDIDAERLELMAGLLSSVENGVELPFSVSLTTNADEALQGADYVITTFRVGGMEGRIVDERVPLALGLLGQETTGAGGFAMAMRTIPVLLEYVSLMKKVCPEAWLINFANPSGLLTDMLLREGGWKRTVGICDAPATMQNVAAALLGAAPAEVFVDYFGLNHLGWVKGIFFRGVDILPQFLKTLEQSGGMPELPFDVSLLTELGMIPNEYLYYYYYRQQAVQLILERGRTRGEWLKAENEALFAKLRQLRDQEDLPGMAEQYETYLRRRSQTYLLHQSGEKAGQSGVAFAASTVMGDSGYAGVALDLIEGLSGGTAKVMTVNVQNQGAVWGMEEEDVVEVPAYVHQGLIKPLAVGNIPRHCLALMKQVKAYERLTISAALEHSFAHALQALTIHPLVGDVSLARQILAGYQSGHGELFPELH
ncbi:MAG: glycoside hydrolase [Chloroflexota bacterium]